MLLSLSACAPGVIAREFGQRLMAIADEGIACIYTETSAIDQKLFSIANDLVQYQNLMETAKEWFDYQESLCREGSRQVEVTPEGLDQLTSGRYCISRLAIEITHQSSTKILEIMDCVTGELVSQQELEASLGGQRKELEHVRQEMFDRRALCVATMNHTLKYMTTWRIRSMEPYTYHISGPALGWDGKLVPGKWRYEQSSGSVQPVDAPAHDLKAIFLCR